MDNLPENCSDSAHLADSVSGQRVYFVPHRWWKDAHERMEGESNGKKGVIYTASPASTYGGPMKIINTIFSSDLAFNLRREDEPMQNGDANGEVGVSGRDFALVSGDMWVEALKWHSESKAAQKDNRSFYAAEEDISDVYPLQLRLSVLRETNSLAIRICKKDNAIELFKRACKIFSIDIDLLRIWDYSGQTTLFFMNDNNRFLKNGARQTDQDVLMELQIYGLSDSMKCREGKKDDRAMTNCNGTNSLSGNLFLGNGSTCNGNLESVRATCSAIRRSSGEAGSLGLTGLQNLGNTCFMNSALQCLAHTPKLIDYFHEDYAREINHGNPLGMDGEIALAFGDLLRKLWAPGATPVAPKTFKSKLARFAPQFSGYNQHDSQELLAFLLDGLHEDLNRVKCKPYVEAKDAEGCPDNEVADEHWHYHLARNDSIIVHVFQGQYKSTLLCPLCKKVSVTFDPFMYLSLPLPSTAVRTMTLTVVSTDGSMQPSPFTISVPKDGKCEDLTRSLSNACSLGVDETLLVAEVYNNCIIRYLEEPSDPLSLVRDADRLVAYRLKKDTKKLPLIVFMHQRIDEQYNLGSTTRWKTFGIPFVARLGNSVSGSDIHSLYLQLFNPFQKLNEDAIDDAKNISEDGMAENNTNTEDASCCASMDVDSSDVKIIDSLSDSEGPELEFYVTDEKGREKGSRIRMDEPVVIANASRQLNLLVCWPEKQIEKYNKQLHDLLPEVYKSGSIARRTQETISLYTCLEAFLKEEPLGPEDMWYCPGCKAPQQAIKKLDLWRLPEILVIHLKRFSYSRYMKTKLETYVDFPIDDLDLSSYIACQSGKPSSRYMLYAISNHYGSMGGGHYTAFVHQGGGRWYDFDDSHVYPISMDKLKTSAAYVLFYRRVVEE